MMGSNPDMLNIFELVRQMKSDILIKMDSLIHMYCLALLKKQQLEGKAIEVPPKLNEEIEFLKQEIMGCLI